MLVMCQWISWGGRTVRVAVISSVRGWDRLSRFVMTVWSQMILLQDQLVLSSQGCFLVLMKRRQWEVASWNTSTSRIMQWRGLILSLVSIKHLLHKMGSWEFERVTIFIGNCHGDELVFFNLDIQHLLLWNPARPQDLSVCRGASYIDGLQGILRHIEAIGWSRPRYVDRQVVIDFRCCIHLYLMQGSTLGGVSPIKASSIALRTITSNDDRLISSRVHLLLLPLGDWLLDKVCLTLAILQLLLQG